MNDEEQQLIRERERATKAQSILENPLWAETWDFMQGNLRAYMEDPNTKDDLVLEARRTLIAVRRLQRHVEDIFTTGKMAQMQLDSIRGDTDA